MAQTAVLLIAHGSRHAPANDDLHQLAARFAGRGDYPIVEPCFLELAEPDIATGGADASPGGPRVLMIPYFLSAGVHLIRDLTAAATPCGAAPGRGVPARPAARPPPLPRRAGRRADPPGRRPRRGPGPRPIAGDGPRFRTVEWSDPTESGRITDWH